MRDTLLHDADVLWPLLEPKVRATVRAFGSTGRSGGGAGSNEHDLGGNRHRGYLRSDQAPQFLLIDGTRPLAGNLAVAANVTIDGVDLSAHAASPDAHHARVHGVLSGDHTVVGSQHQVVGLTGTNTLGLLTPSSTPGANALVRTGAGGEVTLSQLEVTGDLYVDDTLDFGTDTLYEDATYLNVAGSKPVRFAQKIQGGGWSITEPGALAAASGTFAGNVDILGGGDLYVAGSGIYAGYPVLFADSSGGNVGILRAPDPQFALDVAGPLRATYIVGQLAIQLPDVLLLAHFDGRAPFERNFTGELNGHMGQVGKAAGGVVFRPGKFLKAVQIAGAAANLVTNPSFEVDLAGWTPGVTGTGGEFVRVTDRAFVGGACARIMASSGGNYFVRSNQIALANGASVTVQCRIRRGSAIGCQLQIRDQTAGSTRATASPVLTDTWERLTCSWTNNTGATANVEMRVSNTHGDGAGRIWVDACQMELSAYATPYCDGSLGGYNSAGAPDGSGHAWTGTPHASTSTRAAAVLSYPTAGNIDPAKWTIMAWVLPVGITTANQEVLRVTGVTAGNIILRLDALGKPQALAGTAAVTAATAVAAGVWTHLVATYDGATVRVYANGVQAASGASSGFDGLPAAMYVGRASNASNWFNGMIDDLCILPYVADAALIRSIYESNAPVFAESSVYVFRASAQGLISGDDEGLWIRDMAGNPVLGVYAGEAAAKTWGGWTDMGIGDVIIGRNTSGASALRWTQATGKFGFYGNANLTPQVEISTMGDLMAAGGVLQVGSYGMRLRKIGTTDAILLNGDGLLMGAGGARSLLRDWSAGSRVHWFGSEMYEAAPETYTNGGTTFERNPLVIRNVGDSYTGNAGTSMVELAAVSNTETARILLAAGAWLEGYSTTYGAYNIVDVQTDMVVLNEAVLRGQRYAYLGVEWMRFDGTAGATNPISAGALGAYAGKLKINVNGTDRWIPFYA